ncbi:SpvB/TcaC N-terminal domain-containing protein [Sorangium sp. So ce1000]|uniref:SpvB/TcaC N-terminal domain-containing protein n=1 Tax=Sorangium sp. So ce1000 TaxID=3133325 RepID=UPI003F648F92
MKRREEDAGHAGRGAEPTWRGDALSGAIEGNPGPGPRPSADVPSENAASRTPLPKALAAPDTAAERPTAARIAPVGFDAVKPPSLSLPKGGGAMRAIGETFKTNPVTGTGAYAIPLPLPEARGFAPDLALAYDSGSGNGPFGLGWSLSFGSVSRRTDKRLPEYDDASESDVFRLSGSDDLVPQLPTADVVDKYETATHRVQRYRPRTEAGFSRIERWTHKATAEEHWVVLSPSNTKTFYGRSEASRISDPDEPRRVFSWLLDRIEDDRGNVLEVDYKAEDLANVNGGDAAETHRVLRGAPFTNRYPKRVRYAPTIMGNIDSSRIAVIFDYGEHDASAPTPSEAATWHVRQDPFSRYGSGFEVRTYRVCQRILVFHTFAELGESACLTQSVDLTYDQDPYATRLRAVTFAGYTRAADGTYTKKTLPPIALAYSLPTRAPVELFFDEPSLSDLDLDAIGRTAQWVDLEGEGLPGLLMRRAGHAAYKANVGGGVFAGGKRLLGEPNVGMETAGIVDVEGAGAPTLALFDGPAPGTFEREDGAWGAFVPFDTLPTVDWRSSQVRFIDLDGDGRDDLLVVMEDHYVWYPSLGKEGFGRPRRFPRVWDDITGPPVAFFANERMAVFLADMTGDGLPDLVRVTASAVSYWPALGYGRWGRMVEMRNAPWLGGPRDFDGQRVRLADLDGAGPADLLYCDGSGIRIYWNQAGNAFSTEPTVVSAFPTAYGLRTLALIDAFARGTTQITWATSAPGMSTPRLRAFDVVGEDKPWLLTSIVNHMGLETRVAYAPSTKFYREDEASGRPWATKLPFPVHVVERVETYDAVRRHRYVQTYSYHHGGFDPEEREFRGFGRVDTLDAEWVSAHEGKGLFPDRPTPVNDERPQPPVLTKTWYHLGIPKHDGRLEAAYGREQWSPVAGSTDPKKLPGPVFESSSPMTGDEHRDALRALRGQMLRREVYGLDGTAADNVPVQVTETRMRVRREQRPRGGAGATSRQSVMFAHAEEELSITYEKNASDPRVHHALTLAVDTYGFVTRSAVVAYGRQAGVDSEQTTKKIAVSTAAIAHVSGSSSAFRLGVPLGEELWELGRDSAPTNRTRFTRDELDGLFSTAAAVAYEVTTGDGQKRLLGWTKHRYYDSTALPSPLPEGVADARALPYESSAQAFTSGLLTEVYGTDVTAAMLTAAGYVDKGTDGWWATSGREVYDATRFFLPISVIDALGRTTRIDYDTHALFVTTVTAPLGTTTSAAIDYRVLGPWQVTDPNGNRVQAAFDEHGRVVGWAVMGKTGSTEGDTLSDPTVAFTYELDRWDTMVLPNRVKTEAREQHGAANPRRQTSYEYFDGAGGIAMVKVEAEPESPGGPIRWVGTGRTVVNNKGSVIKQYEPYFSTTPEYEDEDDLVATGVTPLWTYDALGRNTRVDLPNGTTRRVVLTPWREEAWDENDTVSDAGNIWFAFRQPGAVPTPSQEEQRAATLAWEHRETPAVTHFDNLGRAYKTEANNGAAGVYVTRTELDLEGQVRTVTDALGRPAATYAYAVDGQVMRGTSIDAGEKRAFANVLGSAVYAWDALGRRMRVEHDPLERPTHLWVKQGAGTEWLAAFTMYGESYPTPEASNLRGKIGMIFDGAGVVRSESFDFKGNALAWSRTLATTFTTEPDWTPLANEITPSAALAAAASLLETETFEKAFAYDALNRMTSATMPDHSEIRPAYNEASLLEKVEVRIRGALTWTTFVSDIDYDAKGRRTRIEYDNGTHTEYTYHALTFRLTRLKTTRASDSKVLQDLRYTFDPVGNIVEVQDHAHQDVFFNDAQVSAHQKLEYDAIYRLIRASGREHAGGIGDDQRDNRDLPLWNLPHPNDAQALRPYEESYIYDAVGNIREFFHDAGIGPQTWRRHYRYGAGTGDGTSNRLHSTSLPGDRPGGTYSASYAHDANGNITAMPHLSSVAYTHRDQMGHANLGGGGDAYYTYDASGERVRKVWVHSGLTEERVYLGGYEVYRKRDSGGLSLERETLHVMDDVRRIAMVETKTVDTSAPPFIPVPRMRFQYGNHLDSTMLECDDDGLVISYEEYHPYGTTAYWSASGAAEVSRKRYRYTGKEKDEETGLYYHGARYYAPWLGRWTAADPAGMVDGPDLYAYGRGSPIMMMDPTGRQGEDDLKNLMSSENPEQNASGEWNGQKPEETPWFVRVSEEENEKARLRQSIRSVSVAVTVERMEQGREPEVDFTSPSEIQQDIAALIAYNNAVWEANEAVRQYRAEQQYRQQEWNATGEGGAPPEGWTPPERTLIPGTGEHIGTVGREVILNAAASPRAAGLVLREAAVIAAAEEGDAAVNVVRSGLADDAASGGVQLPAFAASSIESAAGQMAHPASSQISVGARALAKKLAHAQSGGYISAFEGIAPTIESAQSVVQQIMSSPSRTVFGKRTYDVYNALGRGARFDMQGNFVTFLEAGRATR